LLKLKSANSKLYHHS